MLEFLPCKEVRSAIEGVIAIACYFHITILWLCTRHAMKDNQVVPAIVLNSLPLSASCAVMKTYFS